jgi:hypothetical protein
LNLFARCNCKNLDSKLNFLGQNTKNKFLKYFFNKFKKYLVFQVKSCFYKEEVKILIIFTKKRYFHSFVVYFIQQKVSNQGQVYTRKIIRVSKSKKRLEKITVYKF